MPDNWQGRIFRTRTRIGGSTISVSFGDFGTLAKPEPAVMERDRYRMSERDGHNRRPAASRLHFRAKLYHRRLQIAHTQNARGGVC